MRIHVRTHKGEDKLNTLYFILQFPTSVSPFARQITWVYNVEGPALGFWEDLGGMSPFTQVGHAAQRWADFKGHGCYFTLPPKREEQPMPGLSARCEQCPRLRAGEGMWFLDAYFKNLGIIFCDTMKWIDKLCFLQLQASLVFSFYF